MKQQGLFDRWAGWAATKVSQAGFFNLCVLLVILWAPSYLIVRDFTQHQLLINGPTTVITFLLVALLQNSARRDSDAMHFKQDATAKGLRDLMDHVAHALPNCPEGCDFQHDIERLEKAISIEDEIGTKESK